MGKVQDLLYKEEVYQIIGAAMEVHRILGPGFLEAVYQEALEIELSLRGIPYESYKRLKIQYKERYLKQGYEADFLVFEKIIVEIKAADKLISKNEAQILNYLTATKLKLGVLINFGEESLVWKRFVL